MLHRQYVLKREIRCDKSGNSRIASLEFLDFPFDFHIDGSAFLSLGVIREVANRPGLFLMATMVAASLGGASTLALTIIKQRYTRIMMKRTEKAKISMINQARLFVLYFEKKINHHRDNFQ